jgi:hypothetical protein
LAGIEVERSLREVRELLDNGDGEIDVRVVVGTV